MNDSYIAFYCCVFDMILNIGQYGATWISINTTADIHRYVPIYDDMGDRWWKVKVY